MTTSDTPITIEAIEQAIEAACESAELGEGFGLERDEAVEMVKDYVESLQAALTAERAKNAKLREEVLERAAAIVKKSDSMLEALDHLLAMKEKQ